MQVGKRHSASILALLFYISFCYGKAVPDESPSYDGGYEYTYNFQNDQHEVRPLYDEAILMPPTDQREWTNPYDDYLSNHDQPIFVPPTGHNKQDLNEMLKEYYNLKLDSRYEEMEMKTEGYTHKKLAQTSTPKSRNRYEMEEYEDEYYRSPVISKIIKKPVRVYKNEAQCADCHNTPTEYEMHDHKKMNSNKKTYKTGYKLKDGISHKDTKYADGKFESSTDTLNEYTRYKSMTHKGSGLNNIKVVNRKKYNGKNLYKTKTVLEEIKKPFIVQENLPNGVEPSVPYDSKIKNEHTLNDNEHYQTYDSSEIKVKSKVKSEKHKSTLKPENANYSSDDITEIKSDFETVETISNKIEDFEYEGGKVRENEKLNESQTYDGIESEDEDWEVIIPVSRTKSELGNKEKTKCIQAKSNADETYSVVCSENKPQEPEIIPQKPKREIAPPKVVSVKSKDKSYTQASINYESKERPEIAPPKIVSVKSRDKPYVDSVGYENMESQIIDFEGVQSTSEETSHIIEETNGGNINLFDELSENASEQIDTKLEILNENLNNTENGELDPENAGSGFGMEYHPFNKDFSDVDKFRLSFRNSNIWTLIFNPDAEDSKLKTCLTRNNESGFCMYVQQCPVPNIATSLEQLLLNACVVDEVFIGVCCPEFPVETVKVQWGDNERNSSDTRIDEFEFDHDHENEDCGTRSNAASKTQSCPWKAPLVSMSNGKIFCGGVLIGEEYILTAAHCTTKIPKNQILVRLGQHDESSGEDFAVTEIKRHAQYNARTQQNDIALLKLGRRVPPSDHINMVCLPDDDEDELGDYSGEKANLLGWQIFRDDNPKKYEVLEVINNEECGRKMNTNISPSSLCTEARNRDEIKCNVDSGSPLVFKNDDTVEVIGILSWNRNDCDKRFPSIFSRVSSYLKWIRRHAV